MARASAEKLRPGLYHSWFTVKLEMLQFMLVTSAMPCAEIDREREVCARTASRQKAALDVRSIQER